MPLALRMVVLQGCGQDLRLGAFWPGVGNMRPNKCGETAFLEAALPKASAKIYYFRLRETENLRQRRIRALEHENALLAGVLSEIVDEIARLRKLLTAP